MTFVSPVKTACSDDLLLHFPFDVDFVDVTCHRAVGTVYGEGRVRLVYDSQRKEMVSEFDGAARVEVSVQHAVRQRTPTTVHSHTRTHARARTASCRYYSLLKPYTSEIRTVGARSFQSCSFFSSRFFSRAANLSSGMDDVHATRQVCRPAEKTAGKKTTRHKFCWLHLCKLEICTYISLAAIYGLTAITTILVTG